MNNARPKLALRAADLTADVPLLAIALPAGASANGETLAKLDRLLGGALGRTLARRDFRGGRDETLHLSGGASGPQRILLVGLGKATTAARPSVPGATTSRASVSASMTGRPRLRQCAATLLLPEAMPPVRPNTRMPGVCCM